MAFAAGCGRIAFDPLGEGPDGTCVPAAEVCNGVDDDCNRRVDEGCPCTPFAVTVPNNEEILQMPALAWTGSGYVIGIRRASENRLLHIAADGAIGADHLRVTGNEVFIWDGRLVAIAGGSALTVRELALDGTVLAERAVHTGTAIQDISATRAPGGFDLSWRETVSLVNVGRVQRMTTPNFDLIGAPIGFGEAGLMVARGHARGGNDILVAAYRSTAGLIATIAGSATPIATIAGNDVAVSGDEDGFLIVADGSAGDFMYAHADPSGVLDVAPTPFGTANYAAVAARSRAGSHVAVGFGNLAGVFAAHRFEFDEGQFGSMTDMFTYPLGGATITSGPSVHVDAERTAIFATFGPSPGPTITMFAQTCP